MGEEFYAAVKLVSGEEIFSLVCVDENDGDPIIVLQNPVIIKMINSPNGQFIKVKPWMEIPSDDFFVIKLDKIITITEVSNKMLINCYNNYINEDEDEDDEFNNGENGKVKLSDKMGYVSSVDEARIKLEKIFKNYKES